MSSQWLIFHHWFSTTNFDQIMNFDVRLQKMAANQERTYLMIKPDGVQRGIVGDIIKRFETKGFRLVALKFVQVLIVIYLLKIIIIWQCFSSPLRSCWSCTTLTCQSANSSPDWWSTWHLAPLSAWFGKVWTWSRLAVLCWVRPTQLTPNQAPSVVISASKLAGNAGNLIVLQFTELKFWLLS